MWMTLKLALRNLWRNRRRTLITAASVMFAAFFAITMSSIQKGTWQNTLEGILHNYTGHIQVHAKGYWENHSIDLLLPDRTSLIDTIRNSQGVELVMERLQNFSLVSTGPTTKGVLIAGVKPEQFRQFNNISSKVKKGSFIQDGRDEAVVGEKLAELMGQSVGDTIICISQGYRGNNAVGQYTISGIVDFGNPEFNRQLILIPLNQAQLFYAAEGLLSSLVLITDNIDEVERTAQNLRNILDTSRYEVMDYQELLPALIEGKALDEASAKIILYILYILIGFGILGTVMMMLKERQYEFGVLKAIGMKSRQLFFMIFIEILSIGLIGVLAGTLLALPLVLYFQYNPVHLGGVVAETYEQFNMEPLVSAAIQPGIFFEQAIMVFIMVVLISLYPFFNLRRMKPVEAMRA